MNPVSIWDLISPPSCQTTIMLTTSWMRWQQHSIRTSCTTSWSRKRCQWQKGEWRLQLARDKVLTWFITNIFSTYSCTRNNFTKVEALATLKTWVGKAPRFAMFTSICCTKYFASIPVCFLGERSLSHFLKIIYTFKQQNTHILICN